MKERNIEKKIPEEYDEMKEKRSTRQLLVKPMQLFLSKPGALSTKSKAKSWRGTREKARYLLKQPNSNSDGQAKPELGNEAGSSSIPASRKFTQRDCKIAHKTEVESKRIAPVRSRRAPPFDSVSAFQERTGHETSIKFPRSSQTDRGKLPPAAGAKRNHGSQQESGGGGETEGRSAFQLRRKPRPNRFFPPQLLADSSASH